MEVLEDPKDKNSGSFTELENINSSITLGRLVLNGEDSIYLL